MEKNIALPQLETDLNDIAFICENVPDIKTGQSRGYTVGRIIGRKPNGAVIIRRETVPDSIGDKIAAVMKERAKKEYGGELVTPAGDPLTDTLSRVKPMEEVNADGLAYSGYNTRDLSGVMENVKKKDRPGPR